jgi:Zn-finger nucleic acid-binding protein
MIVVERHGIELDYCLECKGIWFDAGELKLLSTALNIDIDLPDWSALPEAHTSEKYRRCPRCRAKMSKINVGEMLVDRCPNGHGLWFDGGELGRFIEQHITSADSGEAQVIKFLGETFSTGLAGGEEKLESEQNREE